MTPAHARQALRNDHHQHVNGNVCLRRERKFDTAQGARPKLFAKLSKPFWFLAGIKMSTAEAIELLRPASIFFHQNLTCELYRSDVRLARLLQRAPNLASGCHFEMNRRYGQDGNGPQVGGGLIVSFVLLLLVCLGPPTSSSSREPG